MKVFLTEFWRKYKYKIVFSVLTIVILPLALLYFTHRWPFNKSDANSYTVDNSTNGTVTRNSTTINVNEPPPRKLNDNDKARLDSIPKERDGIIMEHELDSETVGFANEISEYLRSKGYRISQDIGAYIMVAPQKRGERFSVGIRPDNSMLYVGVLNKWY